jgi:hypothetical protein
MQGLGNSGEFFNVEGNSSAESITKFSKCQVDAFGQ